MDTRHIIVATTALLAATAAFAEPKCTAAAQNTQPVANTLRTLVDAGFMFERARVTKGNCYALKGTNKVGNKVEIYLNPLDGSNVKTETKGI